jgi:uncharacterized damage-inducible protein DinB
LNAAALPLNDLRYPIGRFAQPETLSPAERILALETLRELPRKLRLAVEDLSGDQIETRYREGGWTVRQLVHHVADSHLNAYARMRLALTEDWPTVKPYQEASWAELKDARHAAIAPSLDLLAALHVRWVELLAGLDAQEWKRGYLHPESGRQSLEQVLALYDWHSRHHLAHVTGLRNRLHW